MLVKTDALIADYLFEVSWEVCNKVGGIYTVLSTKSYSLVKKLQNNYILIGPDLWRGEDEHPEFTEDHSLFKDWKNKALKEGLRVKIGRWNISGNPIVFLVDFTTFIPEKDSIFANFWETYQLDSISGQWDYIEPALFGFTSGKIIESFYKFSLGIINITVAQFHEWMTGTGILYLKKAIPQIATVFTTHATIVGRSLAGNNFPLYKNIDLYNAGQIAKDFNITSKQSLEKLSAQHADCFTTVSNITAKECENFLGKKPDIITPNGFNDSFVPASFNEAREQARNKLKEVTNTLLGYKIAEDSLFIVISGRYEFKNKGIDIFLDSLIQINNTEKTDREIVGFILIPANHYGPRKDLLESIVAKRMGVPSQEKYLTHNLRESGSDPIFRKISTSGIKNSVSDKVKIIYVPCYLDANDGIFNISYYDLLIGFDLSVFPSYYEPWGYTPLESLAFHIPTITTTLTGFSSWVDCSQTDCDNGIQVIPRDDDNNAEVIKAVTEKILMYCSLDKEKYNQARSNAHTVSRTALWENLIDYYVDAYNFSLSKIEGRKDLFIADTPMEQQLSPMIISRSVPPKWKKINVLSSLPDKLKKIHDLISNLWWTWQYEACELFGKVDPVLWIKGGCDPISLLENTDFNKLNELGENKDFIEELNKLHEKFKSYMSVKPQGPKIAYFSMEYGLHDTLKTFSGGLGMLAGDFLKEASDSNINIVGIGLLYRYGYFRQTLSMQGEQEEVNEILHFSKVPILPVRDKSGTWKTIKIALPGRALHARVWEVQAGRTPLYLLDTDFDKNSEKDRKITYQLYAGDKEARLLQELLLGIGGIRALDALGIKADLYHSNEGHSAFIGFERLRKLITENNITLAEAKEVVRASTLFTTHTPVPAGHDSFSENLLRTYIPHYPERLKISWDEFINMGKAIPFNKNEDFNMSYLAAHLSQEINGVSKLHRKVTCEMFNILWEGYLPEELHIDYVTNGVHYKTWTAREWQKLHIEEFGHHFLENLSDPSHWEKIYDVKDETIWELKRKLKMRLVDHIKERAKDNWIKRHVNPKHVMRILEELDENCLTIGFARRFATYKRAYLLFKDTQRLAEIINNQKKPVRFVFAGKAHPNDKEGKDLIKFVIETSKKPEFMGKILFLQNYDIELAKKLIQGVDVWLNTPARPLEASGTSGEKAVLNGTLHFSVLDGWWVEGYVPGAGWALPQEKSYENQDFQDEFDAESIYYILENEIIPLYYKRNSKNIPEGWVKYMKNAIAKIAPHFLSKRMLNDYQNKFYNKLYERSKKIVKNDFELAKKIVSWKRKVSRSWDNIEVVSVNIFNINKEHYQMGEHYKGEVVLDLKELSPSDIGLELVISDYTENNKLELVHKQEFEVVGSRYDKVHYQTKIQLTKPGVYNYGLKIFPKNEDLPHPQDFNYIRWL